MAMILTSRDRPTVVLITWEIGLTDFLASYSTHINYMLVDVCLPRVSKPWSESFDPYNPRPRSKISIYYRNGVLKRLWNAKIDPCRSIAKINPRRLTQATGFHETSALPPIFSIFSLQCRGTRIFSRFGGGRQRSLRAQKSPLIQWDWLIQEDAPRLAHFSNKSQQRGHFSLYLPHFFDNFHGVINHEKYNKYFVVIFISFI